MQFRDRLDAGRRLAGALGHLAGQRDLVVLGLARGGLPLAKEVADALGAPLDVLCVRKLGAPSNPEYAIGAVGEDGSVQVDKQALAYLNLSEAALESLVQRELRSIESRLKLYRSGRDRHELAGRTCVLVDDGLATGFTMRAAIASVLAAQAKKVVVAVPVAPPHTVHEISSLVDEVICLDTPSEFQAVGQFYVSFPQLTDEDVLALLKRSEPEE